jgi:hypothetical protein
MGLKQILFRPKFRVVRANGEEVLRSKLRYLSAIASQYRKDKLGHATYSIILRSLEQLANTLVSLWLKATELTEEKVSKFELIWQEDLDFVMSSVRFRELTCVSRRGPP